MKRDYEIVDVKEFPAPYKERTGRWKLLFNSLPEGKVVKFTCQTQKEGHLLGASILGCCRQGRVNFRTSYRCVPDGDKWLLYVKKVDKESKGG